LKTELLILVETLKKAKRDGANDLAATIAFWAFFSIFPLLIGILTLSSHFLESSSLQVRINEAVAEMLPGSAELVKDNLQAVVEYRGTMGLVALLGLFWAASKGFGAMTRAVNQALGLHSDHKFILGKLRHVAMAAAVSVLAIVSLGITVVLEVVLEPAFLSRFGMDPVEISRVQSWATSFLLVFLIFALIYRLTPYAAVTWSQVLPGALLATVLFELGKTGFVVYLEKMANLQAIYGSLSSIIVLLLWLYVSALILILGAEYNIVRWRIRNETAET
jgi:membrane protein